MRYKFLTTFLVLSVTTSIAQTKKGSWTFNIGFHQTSTYTKLFYPVVFFEGGYPTAQSSARFVDFNVLYSRKTRDRKLGTVYGLGVNQKGYSEKGMVSDGTVNMDSYSNIRKATYVSLYSGLTYDLLSGSKTKMVVGQLINPEITILSFMESPGKIPISARTIVSFERRAGKKYSFVWTPYFQMAITNYNKGKLSKESSNYRPYGFGLNLGIGFGQ